MPLVTGFSVLLLQPDSSHRALTSQLFMKVPLLLPCEETGQTGLPDAGVSKQHYPVEGFPRAFRVAGFRGPPILGWGRFSNGRVEGGRLTQSGMLGLSRGCGAQAARLVAPR